MMDSSRSIPALPLSAAFTLIEMMLASIAAALILAAIYGLFYRAIKMRDSATDRIRRSRLRARAAEVIRNDLKNAYISGGILATALDDSGSESGGGSGFPGYLRLTTTTGKDTADEAYGDVQQVEYYIEKDEASPAGNSGTLVRVVTRDLLDTTPGVTHEERILTGVTSFQVSFYDGSNWQGTWEVSSSNSAPLASSTAAAAATSGTLETLPDAIRIDIVQAPPSDRDQPPLPLEILQPWTEAPFLSGTNFTFGSSSSTSQ